VLGASNGERRDAAARQLMTTPPLQKEQYNCRDLRVLGTRAGELKYTGIGISFLDPKMPASGFFISPIPKPGPNTR
jgi:hypothetical protein